MFRTFAAAQSRRRNQWGAVLGASALLFGAFVALPRTASAAAVEVRAVSPNISISPGAITCEGVSGASGEVVRFSAIQTPPLFPVVRFIGGSLVLGAEPGDGTARQVQSGSILTNSTVNGWNVEAVLTATSVLPAPGVFGPSCGRYTFEMAYVANLTPPGATSPALRERGIATVKSIIGGGQITSFGIGASFTATSFESIGAPVVGGELAVGAPITTTTGVLVRQWARSPGIVNWLSNAIGPGGGVLVPPFSSVTTEGVSTVVSEPICAGNECATGSVQAKVDGTPPVISYSGVVDGATYVADPVISCSASDALSGVWIPSATPFSPPRTLGNGCWMTLGGQSLAERTYTVYANDGAGNVGIVTGRYVVDPTSPSTSTSTTSSTILPPSTVMPTTFPPSTIPPTSPPTTTPIGGLQIEAPGQVGVGVGFRITVRGAVPGARIDLSAGTNTLGSLVAGNDGVASAVYAVWQAGFVQLRATEVVYRAGIPTTRSVERPITVGSVPTVPPTTVSPTTVPPTTVPPTTAPPTTGPQPTTTVVLPTIGLVMNPTAPLLASSSGPYMGPTGRYLSVTPFLMQGGQINLAEFEVLCGGTTPPITIDNGATTPADRLVCVANGVGPQTVVVRDRLGRYATRTQVWIASDPFVVRAVAGKPVTFTLPSQPSNIRPAFDFPRGTECAGATCTIPANLVVVPPAGQQALFNWNDIGQDPFRFGTVILEVSPAPSTTVPSRVAFL